MAVTDGVGLGTPLQNAGAPVAGTNEVQTLTIGGTPTGGTFILGFQGRNTQPITWSNVNATLLTAINNAFTALLGAGAVTASAGTVTAGIGTILLTFGGALGVQAVPNIVVVNNSMTGTSPTLANAETTPGVDATGRTAPKGALLVDTTGAKLYINTGTQGTPTWTSVGSQT